MAWQLPSFMFRHRTGDEADIAKISDPVHSELTDADKIALIDFRVGADCEFSTSKTDHAIEFESSLVSTVNRLVIPAGHNLASVNIKVYSDTSSPVAEIGGNLRGEGAPGGSDVFDLQLTGHSEKFRRVRFASSQPRLSEIWLGLRANIDGNKVNSGLDFESDWTHQILFSEQSLGTITTQLAAPRRRFQLSYRNIDPTNSTFTGLLDDLAQARTRPFYYWPVDSAIAARAPVAPYLVRLTRDMTLVQDSQAMAAGRLRYRVELEMEEVAL